MAIVEARELTKRFDGRRPPAVDNLSLATAEGEYLVLLGPSGSGKTTLLRLIAGLEQPTSGEIYIGGEPMAGLPPRARKHRHGVPELRPLPAQDRPRKHRLPAEGPEVSAGRAAKEGRVGRRGCWASGHAPRPKAPAAVRRRAPAGRPGPGPGAGADVFLLDEPLSNLDAKLRATARDELKQFQERRRDHHDLRDPRPGGGDGPGRPDRGDVGGALRQIGTPARRLRRSGRHLRGHLRRFPADEPGRAGGRHRRLPAREAAAQGVVDLHGEDASR